MDPDTFVSDMGRDRHGPRSTWAEVYGPRSTWAEIDEYRHCDCVSDSVTDTVTGTATALPRHWPLGRMAVAAPVTVPVPIPWALALGIARSKCMWRQVDGSVCDPTANFFRFTLFPAGCLGGKRILATIYCKLAEN